MAMQDLTLFFVTLFFGCILVIMSFTAAAKDGGGPTPHPWKAITTVEETLARWPKRMALLFDALDLDQPELKSVQDALARDDRVAAGRHLLRHYAGGQTALWLRDKVTPGETEVRQGRLNEANDIINDIYRGFGEKGPIPRLESGHLNWSHYGPKNDMQFACRVNRHGHLSALLHAYYATGEKKYLQRLDQDLRDWLVASGNNPNPGFGPGQLEAALRMPVWSTLFYRLQDADGFQPATRLLLLASLPGHAQYLQKSLKPHHNFATMQMRGLGMLGLAFPEFKRAEHWYGFAVRQLTEELQVQVYPDGVQKELTATYHAVALGNFKGLADYAIAAGRELPEEYGRTLEQMLDYLAGVMGPDGIGPLNNDSDSMVIPRRLLPEAEPYGRPDWTYVATFGAEGEKPAGPPSRYYAWPGQLISRDHWGADAQWSFFDAGVYGISHQHNDKLHLSIRAHGRPLLVDSGRFAYQGAVAEKYRKPYALHTRAHNTIMINGWGQQAYTPEAQSPHIFARVAETFDFALGVFDAGYDPTPTGALEAWNGLTDAECVAGLDATHSRAVVYLHGQGWVVIDQVQAAGSHRLNPLWHLHPDCTVTEENGVLRTTDTDKGNLHLQPVGPLGWQTRLVKGQEKPTLQGWYSRSYGEVEAAPCAVYESQVQDAAIFGWVLTTAKGEVTPPQAEWLDAPAGVAQVRCTWPEGPAQTITVVMDEAALPVALPDGRTLAARLLIEEDGKGPQVACGWLTDAQGKTMAVDPLPEEAALADLANGLTLQPVAGDGDAPKFVLPLINSRFRSPLQVHLQPAKDNGAGWTCKNLPAEMSLAPGEKKEFALALDADPIQPRYPLPQVQATLILPTDEERQVAVRQTATLTINPKDLRPTLTLRHATQAPEIDGSLAEAAWPDQPDVPLLGRMDQGRTIAPATAAWMAHDEEHLYLAFRCAEPRMDALRLAAKERDEAVAKDDSVEVLFQPNANGKDRDYVQVIVSAAGVVFDAKGHDHKGNLPGVKTATANQTDGWTAEIAIPWADLGLDGPPQQAGLLLGRNRYAGGKTEIFQFPVSPKGNHQPDRFARLQLQRKSH